MMIVDGRHIRAVMTHYIIMIRIGRIKVPAITNKKDEIMDFSLKLFMILYLQIDLWI